MSDETAQGDGDGYGGMLGRDTGVFVDFLFSLVAILIVALSYSRDELNIWRDEWSRTTGQLRSMGLTREFILGALMCGYDNVEYDPAHRAAKCKNDDEKTFAHENFTAALNVDGESGVLIVSDKMDYNKFGKNNPGGVFIYNSSAASGHGRKAIKKLRKRLDATLPCFSAFDRDRLADVDVKNINCTPVLEEGRKYIAARTGRSFEDINQSDLAVVDLVMFEGHSDGYPNGKNDIGEQRARNFLLTMLDDNHDPAIDDDAKTIKNLDDLDGVIYKSILYKLISVTQRITQECRDKSDSNHWCASFSKNKDSKNKNKDSENKDDSLARKQAPRIFALSSFGRYSLRAGDPTNDKVNVNSQDRRVEIRIIMADVPRGLWATEQQRETEKLGAQQRDLVRLISAQTAAQLLACDAAKKTSCVNDLVSSGSGGS